jgi:hypothetical protein
MRPKLKGQFKAMDSTGQFVESQHLCVMKAVIKLPKLKLKSKKATKIFPENQYKVTTRAKHSFSRKEQDTCSTIYFRH